MKAAAVALLSLALSSFAGAATTSGRIVFAATDDPSSGDVLLVRADGTQLDLSGSEGDNTSPVLSPDGKLVAFFSTRGGHGAEWVVGTDGKGLRQVTPALGTPPTVAWAPNGTELAVTTPNEVHRARAQGGVWARIDLRDHAQGLAGWSPSGAAVAYYAPLDNVVVVSRTGRRLRTLDGDTALWSPTGRIAVRRNSETWDVYRTDGRRLATIAASQVAWSPDGRLASVTRAGVVQVRAGGAGKPTRAARPVRNAADPRWIGETHLLLRGDDGYVSYDVAHRATFEVAAGYRLDPSLAQNGTAYGEWPWGTLVRSTPSGSTRVVDRVAACQGKDTDAFLGLQTLPDASGAVFAGDCAVPNDLFSVRPDGDGLTRLTHSTADELDPALSPDGTRLAFARVDGAGCDGCTHQIWTTSLDGGTGHSVTLPTTKSAILQDDRPSFSPDGTRIVFARSDAAITGDGSALYTAPATGGAATPLNVPGGYPAWGPARIAFAGRDGVDTANPDGSGAQKVAAADAIPAWSQDGRLAVLEWETGFSIVLPATGKRLALPGLHGAWPGLAWSPDGSRLAFTADGDVWTIGADGTGLTRVTHGLGANGALSWR